MADDIISVSVVVNAPVERVWPLLVEHIEVSRSQAQESLQSDPPGPPLTGRYGLRWLGERPGGHRITGFR